MTAVFARGLGSGTVASHPPTIAEGVTAIVAALPEEVAPLRARLTSVRSARVRGAGPLWLGELEGAPVALALLDRARDERGAIRRTRVARALLGDLAALPGLLELRRRVQRCADVLCHATCALLSAQRADAAARPG